MAGKGRAPKAGAERRHRGAPQRGDWTDLAQTPKRKAPAMPARGKGRGHWSPRTRRAWKSWWRDPASLRWSAGDIDLVEHLADVFEEWVREPKASMAAEVRQVRDSLGLTPKGKQDRRWRVVAESDIPRDQEQPPSVTALDDYRKTLGVS